MKIAEGFRAREISKTWGVRLKNLEYRRKIQQAMVLNSLIQLHDLWREKPRDDFASRMAWRDVLNGFAVDLCALKHPSFFEEKEFRVIRLVLCKRISDKLTFRDPGARKKGEALEVRMRTKGEAEIGYVEYPIDPHGHGTIVGEVVVCPKNTYTERDIADRVAASGFKKVRIRKSDTSYR